MRIHPLSLNANHRPVGNKRLRSAIQKAKSSESWVVNNQLKKGWQILQKWASRRTISTVLSKGSNWQCLKKVQEERKNQTYKDQTQSSLQSKRRIICKRHHEFLLKVAIVWSRKYRAHWPIELNRLKIRTWVSRRYWPDRIQLHMHQARKRWSSRATSISWLKRLSNSNFSYMTVLFWHRTQPWRRHSRTS